MLRKFAAAILSALLLSTGWLGMTGLTLLVAFVPLLWLSAERDGSRRAWWGMFGWALLTFVLWNAMTVWWIWNATPVGPIAATLASTFLNMLAFMAFHTVSKRAPKALAYTLLVAGWLTTEYWYTTGEFSWPWLILGNGFSHDIRLVQWYEYTGVFGGSLWVLLVNILLFETLRSPSRRRALTTAAAVLLPMLLSLGLYAGYEEPEARARVTLVQPNVDCYDKFAAGTEQQQMENLLELAGEAPADADYILLPETAVPGYWWESSLRASDPVQRFAALLRERQSGAMLITGANTLRHYPAGTQSETARPYEGGGYIDIYNTALGIDSTGGVQLHHKGRLVIGVENTPTWVFDVLKFLVIDLGGTLGQIGIGRPGPVFEHNGLRTAAPICYEGLYGNFCGEFVRHGARAFFIISNDGWWGDTPGYRHLFTISRLRAVEHRRAVARAANTGMSGFITARGDIGRTLGWQERGTLTDEVALNDRLTFYTRYGDYIARIAQYVALLCVLYYVAYRVRKRNYLVD